jgi:hypothetical protein
MFHQTEKFIHFITTIVQNYQKNHYSLEGFEKFLKYIVNQIYNLARTFYGRLR